MSPLFCDGQLLQVDTQAYARQTPEVSDIILCEHPYRKDFLLIKKIEKIDEHGKFFVVGVNTSSSTDSRSFGSIHRDAILGKVNTNA